MVGKKLALLAVVAGAGGLLALPVFSSAAKDKPAALNLVGGYWYLTITPSASART